VVGAAANHLDYAGMTDAELTVLEEILARHTKPGPPPAEGTVEAKLAEALHDAEFWRTECESLHGRMRSAEAAADRRVVERPNLSRHRV
jgi:hypothetical protein